MEKYSNHLINETSPYLLQHAHNPFHWYPCVKEALERAKKENKPILLSIGYSSCHWCHVMEKESFEDEETAKIMNDNYINIKVDREERPDLDEIYMNAVQLMTGSGGWPMTVFLTPDLLPFFSGTYFPPEERQGIPSFKQVLSRISEIYNEKNDEVQDISKRTSEEINRMAKLSSGDGKIKPNISESILREILQRVDYENGGFSDAPKFPQPMLLELLFKYY